MTRPGERTWRIPAIGSAAIALCGLLWPSFLSAQGESQPRDGARLGPWSEAVAAAWWQQHAEPDRWHAEAERIVTTLRETQKRHGLAAMIGNAHWTGWMLHARWLRLFPKDWQNHPTLSEAVLRNHYVSFYARPETRQRLLAALVPEDDSTAALDIFLRLSQTYPEDFEAYLNLAIAYAVVFDQPFPDSWPHAFVDPNKLATGDPDPVDRFAFVVDCHKADRLLLDPRDLSVRDLTFLVDSPLSREEFRYAQQIDLGTPQRLGQLYPALRYDQNRVNSRRYAWPAPNYQLVEIGRRGGICMDLAFFVSQTGKAKGVPTLLFVGQGLSGEHGWVGFLRRSGQWDLDVARNRGQEYPIGQAYDPQTWLRITDTEMEHLVEHADRFEADAFGPGQLLLQWAALNQQHEDYPEILKAARRAMPSNPLPWRLEAEWLESREASADRRLEFWQDWSRHFDHNVDLRVKGQIRSIAILEASGQEREAEQLRQRVVAETRSQRFDLGIAMAADPIFRHLERNEWEAAEERFEDAMRRFRSKAGGHLFYHLLQPYALTCAQESQFDQAERALEHLERGFEVSPGSMLDNNMNELRNRVMRR